MHNLIAYIPVLNQLYLNWLGKHQGSSLFLVTESLATSLDPSLARNMVCSPAVLIANFARCAYPSIIAIPFSDPNEEELLFYWEKEENIIMPDDSLSHTFAEKHLYPKGYKVEFEQVWGRWDMTAVKREEPVIPDLEVSSEETDRLRMEAARKLAQKSPDWWRQVGAMAFRGSDLIAVACNTHYPNEYETMIFGDPRIVFQAGDPAGAEIYLSLHAEEGIITACADHGVPLRGASIYVTVFPCSNCARRLAACHIKELFFSEGYSALGGLRTLQGAGVRIVKVKDPEPA